MRRVTAPALFRRANIPAPRFQCITRARTPRAIARSTPAPKPYVFPRAGVRGLRYSGVCGGVVFYWWSKESVEFGGTNMNWDQVEGKWKQYKGEMKEKWGKLTDDDFDV